MTQQQDKKRLVVIGNGMAPGRVIERLLALSPEKYQITIFNAEPRVNYDRIMLSPVLAGEKSYEDIIIHDEDWYTQNDITLYKGDPILFINRSEKFVVSKKGVSVNYDTLLIATGSSPILIPLPGHDLDGVLTYRDLDDVEAMVVASKNQKHAVVIGGGLLGLEAAAGLQMRGMIVTVLHLMPTLMERQLDAVAGELLKNALEARGINVLTRANTARITGTEKVAAVHLDDGTVIKADIVCMAVGIKPNADLAKAAGLKTNRGIIVQDDMRTSDPDIFAVGECVEHNGQCYGLVVPLYEMAVVVAAGLSGQSVRYKSTTSPTKLKVTGIDLFSAGEFEKKSGREEIIIKNSSGDFYKRLVIENNKIVGVVLFGDTADGAWFFNLLKRGVDISTMRQSLIFGTAHDEEEPLTPYGGQCSLTA
ncbi:MAG: NAD(P)/FAD-dependent oxidoreductase [Sneathiella sp.]|nr:NAD(P)/FAD-dependent oxidoreductase [Sneathiella sp.]